MNEWVNWDASELRRIYQRLNAEWQRAAAGFEQQVGHPIRCRPGCCLCCCVGSPDQDAECGFGQVPVQQGLDVHTSPLSPRHTLPLSLPEAILLWQALIRLPRQEQECIMKQHKSLVFFDPIQTPLGLFAQHYRERCPLLMPEGQCSIYKARPLVCRIVGLPVHTIGCPLNAPGQDGASIQYADNPAAPDWARRWLRETRQAHGQLLFLNAKVAREMGDLQPNRGDSPYISLADALSRLAQWTDVSVNMEK